MSWQIIIGNIIGRGRGGGSAGPDGSPSSLVLTVVSDTVISAAFSSSSTNQDGYRVYVGTDGVTFGTTFTGAASPISLTGLTHDTLYYAYVVAYKGSTESSVSSTRSKKTARLWYLITGLNSSNAIGVYNPLRALNLANSYVNIANTGVNDATPVVAPTWNNTVGWIFDGSSQYLTTGIIPDNDQTWTMIVKFNGFTGSIDTPLGLYEGAAKQFYIQIKRTTNQVWFSTGGTKAFTNSSNDALFAFAGNKGYFNGVNFVTAIPAGSGGLTYDIWIGVLHYSSLTQYFHGNIQSIAIYDTTLTDHQVFIVSRAMILNNMLASLWEHYVDRQFGALICWTIDSFTNTVPNTPDGDVNDFNPSDLDIDQWLDACVAAGMKYAALTVKAEDGFCLWPTEFAVAGHSPYSIGSTTWYTAQGNRDVTLEFITKCREHNLAVGLYFGVMDLTWETRTGEDETSDAAGYIAMVQTQLSELLTNYGSIDFLWLDSWKMRIGYEEIPFLTLFNYIKAIQPACIVIDNNHEHPTWASEIEVYEQPLPDGSIPADNLSLAEEVVSIRNDGFWYYDSTKDQSATGLQSAATIAALKTQVNARHGTLLLGISPDTTGHLPAAQVAILEAL